MREFKVREITVSVPKDEFGPEHVYEVYDQKTQETKGWVVVDNTARSPLDVGKGGTAMYPDLTLDITLRKARIMTWKQVFCAPIGEKSSYPAWGGAKGGIIYDSNLPDAREVLMAWAKALGNYEFAPGKFVIPDKYIFGLDVGLRGWAAQAVVEALGNNPKASTGKPKYLGGIPYDELGITGLGVLESVKVNCPYANVKFKNAAISLQGLGAVGKGFIEHLKKMKKPPRIVAVSDSQGAVYLHTGFDLDKLLMVKEQRGSVIYYNPAQRIEPGEELFLSVDILILSHKEDQITAENVHKVQAKIIGQGANLGITPEAEKFLHQKGIWTLPDFVVNCGASKIVYMEYAGGTTKKGMSLVKKVIGTNSKLIIEESIRQGNPPREVAQKIAEKEVRKAMEERESLHRAHRFYDRNCLE